MCAGKHVWAHCEPYEHYSAHFHHCMAHPEALCNVVVLSMSACGCIFFASHGKQIASFGEFVLFSKDPQAQPEGAQGSCDALQCQAMFPIHCVEHQVVNFAAGALTTDRAEAIAIRLSAKSGSKDSNKATISLEGILKGAPCQSANGPITAQLAHLLQFDKVTYLIYRMHKNCLCTLAC